MAEVYFASSPQRNNFPFSTHPTTTRSHSYQYDLTYLFLDWPAEETEAANQQQGNSTTGGTAADHLWEESWDDDDTSDDFSAQLR